MAKLRGLWGERSAAERELAWAEREADAEVEARWRAAGVLADQLSRLRGTYLARAEESLRISLAAYQEGAMSLLQVIDASRTLGDARSAYYRTVFAHQQSLLDLNAAVGAAAQGDAVRNDSSTDKTGYNS